MVSLLVDDEVRELGLEGEEAACLAAGLEFRSLPIPDRTVPALDELTAGFVRGVRDALVAGRSVAVHCRAGIGRSTLIAASALCLLGVAPDEALARFAVARGLPVPDTDEQRRWVYDFSARSAEG